MNLRKILTATFAATLATTTLTTTADAAEYRWSCRSVPAGHTYSMVRADQGCEPLYLVMLPEPGIWACTVPAGFTYTVSVVNSNCTLGGSSTRYLLAAA
ncbi:hypothetical protein [Actinokineospora diospyrosa]|uniref:Alpha amylase inhibitor n=1 Tax=Actinokineospora diospyrosa TaxID=103728 RepID=A0ABT1IKP2_9PSEU|nr:hypothetical protein [Actinokineospora diospyrosa]MCP2273081.1 hypothetical protein [Actinokineospora diospyrosa]